MLDVGRWTLDVGRWTYGVHIRDDGMVCLLKREGWVNEGSLQSELSRCERLDLSKNSTISSSQLNFFRGRLGLNDWL